MSRKKAVVICPGRGVYNKTELGYLTRYHQDKLELVKKYDQLREQNHQVSITELDQASKFSPSIHTRGENAASLIYTCSLLDFQSINRELFDIVAITGNSMGWYTALACGQALDFEASYHLVNTMGSMLKDGLIGGQLIYPIVDTLWRFDIEKYQLIKDTMAQINAEKDCEIYTSIHFGGYIVLGGNELGVKLAMQRLPKIEDRFPMKLAGNGAFHTPLFSEISQKAQQLILEDSFQAPAFPLIDGRGKVWQPLSCDVGAMYRYTLNHQVTKTYDFSKAIEVALKEFAPDCFILLGPGSTMGGAIAQILIQHNWHQLETKEDFIQLQQNDPYIYSMGLEQQRRIIC